MAEATPAIARARSDSRKEGINFSLNQEVLSGDLELVVGGTKVKLHKLKVFV